VKVFISHGSSDRWVARQIASLLDARGITTFLDEKDILTGDQIPQEVQHHLADCDEVLMLLSPVALKSAWVLIEIGGALALKKRLVPILLHSGPNDLPDAVSASLARDINDLDRYLDEVEARAAQPPRQRRKEAQAAMPTPKQPVLLSTYADRFRFKVGARVRLPSERPQQLIDRSGTDVGWNAHMDQYLGQSSDVIEASIGTVRVAVDGGRWLWSTSWLEPADDG
jgi:hypothetical protein